jgi:hypothetical protein
MIELTKIDIEKNTVTTINIPKGLTKLATEAGASYDHAKLFKSIYAIEAYKTEKTYFEETMSYDPKYRHVLTENEISYFNLINDPYKLAAYEITKKGLDK